jgi:hypothetical protein
MRRRDEQQRHQDDFYAQVFEHLAILSKLIHYIATCIVNGAAARNLDATVPTSTATTSL